jgi:predicted nucleotidyltransferase
MSPFGLMALPPTMVCMLPFSSMSGEFAAKVEPIATLHAVDRNGRTIDLAPAWPLLHRVLREWNPERIQLFGSRARGEANLESDWDILVVVPEASLVPADPLVPWRLRRDTGVRADVIVYSSREFEAERDVPNTLAYEATSAGVALYER